jgi:peptidoglycan/LPS O-acetylase OafA/YrhL
LGVYRFFLALCVLYSHAFGNVFGKNPGVIAVISFFVISGYVMAILIEKHYPSLASIPAYLLDRALRLFPQYLFYLVLTLAVLLTVGLKNEFVEQIDLVRIALNALILPIGFYMFGLYHSLYIPPAWSLGLELSFYLTFPLFLLINRASQHLILAFSFGIAVTAYFGIINTDWFGYRLLPGTFFIFVLGAALAAPSRFNPIFLPAVVVTSLLAVIGSLLWPNELGIPNNFEVSAGVVIGVAAVSLLKDLQFSHIDELLGNLSYGVFLNHYLLIMIAQKYQIPMWPFVPIVSITNVGDQIAAVFDLCLPIMAL